MTQFEIDSFATASGGGGGVVSGAYQLSGIYQVSGEYAFDFAKQISGLYVTHSGGFYAPSGSAGVGGGGTVSGWAQASGLYVEHSGGLYQPSGVYVGASGGLYQASGIFQTSGVFQTSGLYVTHSGGFYQPSGIYQVSGDYPLAHTKQASGIYQVSGDYPLAHTKQASGIYLLTSGGLYQVSGIYPTSGLFALSGTGGVGGGGTSGFIHAGTFLGSGNSSNTLYTLSHGLGQVPDGISVDAASPQARGDIDISGNASGIFVTYTNPPLSGDVKLSWVAGPSASAGGIISGLFALSGAGGLGGVSGVVHAATFLGSGDNSISVYTLSHGLGIAPKGISVEAGSPAARGSFDVSGDASNIYVKYPVPPVSGDVRLSWIAGPTDVVNLVMGSGWVHAATFLGSGDNSTKLYTLSHGLERIPTGISVQAASPQARGDYDVSGNASGIYVTYTSPPLSGDVKLSWVAGPSTISNIVTLGSGTVHAATFLGSGNASTTTYTLSHGIGAVPQGLVVSPMSPNARGDFDVSGNASGIFVTYPIAPASGDVKLSWMAGPSTLVTISGNLVHGGEFIGSGNNSTTQYTLSHGLGLVPSTVIVKEGSPQARGLYDVSGNASGLFVTYTSPPASGTVRLFWQAGPTSIAVINAQSGIYTITSGSSINGVVTGTPMLGGSLTLASGMSGINFSGMQQFPTNVPVKFVMWISGSTYRVLNTDNGMIEYSGSSALSGIQYALQNIGAGSAGANRPGGRILLRKGGYTFPSTIWWDHTSGSTSGIVPNITIQGEGTEATDIVFNTSGTTEGFHIRANYFGLRDMTIGATHSGDIKLVRIMGSSLHGKIYDCFFDGAGSAFISGQYGVHIDNSGQTAAYYIVHRGNFFNNLDVGINLAGNHANAQMIEGCQFETCNYGIKTMSGNTQCVMQNLHFQGSDAQQIGIACVELGAGAALGCVTNVFAETFVSGSAAVVIRSGTVGEYTLNGIMNSNHGMSGNAVRDIHDFTSGASINIIRHSISATRSKYIDLISGLNWKGHTSTTRTITTANSGAFAPAGFMTVDISGTAKRVPYFDT